MKFTFVFLVAVASAFAQPIAVDLHRRGESSGTPPSGTPPSAPTNPLSWSPGGPNNVLSFGDQRSVTHQGPLKFYHEVEGSRVTFKVKEPGNPHYVHVTPSTTDPGSRDIGYTRSSDPNGAVLQSNVTVNRPGHLHVQVPVQPKL